jgi:acetylornithine deacetylase/succinyl-diaminopimelate desuccinylase
MKEGYVHMPLETDSDDPFVQLVLTQLEAAKGDSAELSYFPAWTDGGLLSFYGKIPTVIYGPGCIACCHSKEEYIEIDELTEGCLTYALCAAAFCGTQQTDRSAFGAE